MRVWVALLVATAVSIVIVESHPFGPAGYRVGAGLSLVIAFGKAFLIGREFMEVRGTPKPLQIAFSFWILLFGCATTVLAVG